MTSDPVKGLNREWIPNLVLSIFSVFLSLLIVEFAFRYLDKAWPFDKAVSYPPELQPQEYVLRWRMRSDKPGRNSLGLRNREVQTKAEGVYRVMFLGDSLIFSGDTTSGALYTQVIEEVLNRALHAKAIQGLPGTKRIEVINAGVPGYTTYQELEFLKLHGLAMEPDMVVLGFVFNDLYYPYLHRLAEDNMLAIDPESQLHRFDTSKFPGSLLAHSYLAHKLAFVFKQLLVKLGLHRYYEFEHRPGFYLAWQPYAWGKAHDLVRDIRDLLEENEIRMAMVMFPVSDQVDDTYLSLDSEYVLFPQAQVRQMAQKLALPLYDMTPTLYKNGGRALYTDYLHLTGSGNDLVAKDLGYFLTAVMNNASAPEHR